MAGALGGEETGQNPPEEIIYHGQAAKRSSITLKARTEACMSLT